MPVLLVDFFIINDFRFNEGAEAKALRAQEKYFILRPETFESYFILWRLTHDQRYRDWGWDAVQAIERYCRSPGGFSGIKNVYLEDPQKDDVQQSFFIAEVLKVFDIIMTRNCVQMKLKNIFPLSICICYTRMIHCCL